MITFNNTNKTSALALAPTEKTMQSKLFSDEGMQQQMECLIWLAEFWLHAKVATDDHPILEREGARSFGLKCLGDSLLISMSDVTGTIHGIQFIYPDGTHEIVGEPNTNGHFFQISVPKDCTVAITIDYLTAAFIHKNTGHCVMVAFTLGNILPVAEIIRKSCPTHRIIIILRDDQLTENSKEMVDAIKTACVVNPNLAVYVSENITQPIFKIKTSLDINGDSQDKGLLIEDAILACVTPGYGEDCTNVTPESPQTGVCDVVTDKTAKAGENMSEGKTDFVDVEPYKDPVDAVKLLNDIAFTVKRFIVCSDKVVDAVTLWIAMTWYIDVLQVAPLAVIMAPEKRCGKSQLLFLIGRLVRRAIAAGNITSAALFRVIDAWNPTLLLDEADTFLCRNKELLGVLNCGHTRNSAYILRVVDDEPTKFSVFGAKAIAGIGRLTETLMDRSIVFELRRKLPHESTERLRYAEPDLFETLAAKLARFAIDHREQVRTARPALPEQLNDRAQDNWEPLLAIADIVGGEWPVRARQAAVSISGGNSSTRSVGEELLRDIQSIFAEKGVDRVFSKNLIENLCADEERPWASFDRGKSISPRQVSSQLHEYGILPRSVRIGSATAKGYMVDQFEEAFQRYL